MDDLRQALSDIAEIRGRIVASTTFRGLGPVALAATGVLALAVAFAQSLFLPDPDAAPLAFFGDWIATGVVSTGIIGFEMLRRLRRTHAGLADDMILTAAQQFLPALLAGAILVPILAWFAPDALWMLPGLWEILVGLGIFAFARSLPGPVSLAAAWYFVAGFAVLMFTATTRELSPWVMGLPFAGGQFLMALLVELSSRGSNAEG